MSPPWTQMRRAVCRYSQGALRPDSRPESTPLRVEDPLFKVPVFVAFVFLSLYAWYPFGICSSTGKCLESDNTSHLAEILFLLGLFVVTLKMRMWPRKAWTRPPNLMFSLYKFFFTLFLLEFGMRCVWRPLERFLFSDLSRYCDKAIENQSFGMVGSPLVLESLCNIASQPTVLTMVAISFSALFLWSALLAARYLSMDLMRDHIWLVISALTTVAMQYLTNSRCPANSDVLLSLGGGDSVGSPFWMQ